MLLVLRIPSTDRELPRLVQTDELLRDPGDLTRITLPGLCGWYGHWQLLLGLRLERLYVAGIRGARMAA